MCQCTQREVNLEFASELAYKGLPHKSARCVIREGEVNGFIEELFEFLLVTFLRLTCATNDCDTSIFSYPLSSPFRKGTLYTIWTAV
jgi:hypothetical protein